MKGEDTVFLIFTVTIIILAIFVVVGSYTQVQDVNVFCEKHGMTGSGVFCAEYINDTKVIHDTSGGGLFNGHVTFVRHELYSG